MVLSRQANIAIYFREEKNLAPDALAEINALRKKFDRVLSNLLAEGVAAGEFDVKDVNLAALAIGGMISWAYTWHRPEGRLPLEDMCERMADLALQMVGVRSKVTASDITGRPQRLLQRRRHHVQRHAAGADDPALTDKAMQLVGEVQMHHPHAFPLQPFRIRNAFVAQRIIARGQHQRRRRRRTDPPRAAARRASPRDPSAHADSGR